MRSHNQQPRPWCYQYSNIIWHHLTQNCLKYIQKSRLLQIPSEVKSPIETLFFTATVFFCKQAASLFDGCVIAFEFSEGTSSHNHTPNIKYLGIAWTCSCFQPCTHPTTWWFFSGETFLPSLWVTVIYAHVYWCLSDAASRCLLSSTISSQMNHQWTNWGMSQRSCNIYWGYASLWTSSVASQCNGGKTDGLRSWHVWTLKHLGFMELFYASLHIWFTSCSEIMAQLLLSFRLLNTYCHDVVLIPGKISGSLLFWETSESCSTDPWKSLISV